METATKAAPAKKVAAKKAAPAKKVFPTTSNVVRGALFVHRRERAGACRERCAQIKMDPTGTG